MSDPMFNTPISHLLTQVWKYRYPLTFIVLLLFIGLVTPHQTLNLCRITRISCLFLSTRYFVNFLMHTGLTIPIPFLGSRTLIPQFVPNDCKAASKIWGNKTVWPCQQDVIMEWIGRVLEGYTGWKIFLDPGCLVAIGFGLAVVTNFAAFVWASGIFPDAGWRKWAPGLGLQEEKTTELGLQGG